MAEKTYSGEELHICNQMKAAYMCLTGKSSNTSYSTIAKAYGMSPTKYRSLDSRKRIKATELEAIASKVNMSLDAFLSFNGGLLMTYETNEKKLNNMNRRRDTAEKQLTRYNKEIARLIDEQASLIGKLKSDFVYSKHVEKEEVT